MSLTNPVHDSSDLLLRIRRQISWRQISRVMQNTIQLLRHHINHLGAMVLEIDPRGRAAGLARSLLALGTLLTILATPQDQLFFRSTQYPEGVVCSELGRNLSLYCILDPSSWVTNAISILILLAVISGIVPMFTSWLHAWLAWSFAQSAIVVDGGDHVAQALTLLFIIFHFGDRRLTHWNQKPPESRLKLIFAPVRAAAVLLFSIQGSAIYLHASIAKFGIPEWANATAIWYWLRDPTFAPPSWLFNPLNALLSYAPTAIVITYGVLAFEFLLGIAILLRASARRLLLIPAITLHVGFALAFGLWSFLLSMSSLLIMYLYVSTYYSELRSRSCCYHL